MVLLTYQPTDILAACITNNFYSVGNAFQLWLYHFIWSNHRIDAGNATDSLRAVDNTFVVDIGNLAVIGTNNAAGNFSAASFTGNTMSGNIINISIKLSQKTNSMFFVDPDNTSQIRCILTCRKTSSCHCTVALNIFYITGFSQV